MSAALEIPGRIEGQLGSVLPHRLGQDALRVAHLAGALDTPNGSIGGCLIRAPVIGWCGSRSFPLGGWRGRWVCQLPQMTQ